MEKELLEKQLGQQLEQKKKELIKKYDREIDSFKKIFSSAEEKGDAEIEEVKGIGKIFKVKIMDEENSIIAKFTETILSGGRERGTIIEFFFSPQNMNMQKKIDLLNKFENTLSMYKFW